ncbi:MAG TPA: VOC family protein [Actinophytocola sp.]|uniref:VOC family protein n=1 Tax=Actinophytocola sp. TaxID=1872138 RepID=UPI002DDDA964|nr:VOC family protein [Actinophytocola sp.]HEV2778153.1 VOC family protein [Actinophytocola sp.]
MKLTFLFQPVKDIKESVAFYRDRLGLDESWREGESTVAFKLPGSEVELMLDTPPDDGPQWGAGAMYAIDSVDTYLKEHPDLQWVGGVIKLPGGKAATFLDPSGNCIHLFDQSTAGPE